MLHDPFRFGSSATIVLKDATYFDVQPSGSASASFTLGSNGMASGGPAATPGDAASYLFRNGETGAAFEVDVSIVSGSLTSGPTGSGLGLGTTRTWTKTNSVPGTALSVELQIVLRRSGGGTILSTKNIILTAELDAGSGGGGGPPGGGGGGGDIEN